MNTRSVRYSFSLNERTIVLKKAVASLAVTPPSELLDKRVNTTGIWMELEDENGNLLYRRDIYLDAERKGFSQEKEFCEVLMPYLPEAAYIAVYAPSIEQILSSSTFGAESVCIGRFDIPNPELPETVSDIQFPCDICGDGNGMVLGVTQIKKVASKTNAYNLILLADKFCDDQDKFITTAMKCCDYLYSRPPFSDFIGVSSLNVWAVKIKTNKGKTYFDTSYSYSSDTTVSWKMENVDKVCNALFSDSGRAFWNWAGIIINDDKADIGTTWGSTQFAISTLSEKLGNSYPWLVFQHEFGHAAFGLANEYTKKGSDYDMYSGEEPNMPNVTKEHTLDKLKWRSLVTEGTKIPTDSSYGKKHKSSVGCYKGGFLYRNGIYRPKYHCVMNDQRDRDVDGYYCPVCNRAAKRVLSKVLNAYIPDSGIIYYSSSSKKWYNYSVASEIQKYNSKKNWNRFEELLSALKSGACQQVVIDFFQKCSNKKIETDLTIIPTVETGNNGERGVWYLRSESTGAMYYIITFKEDTATDIHSGALTIPPYLNLLSFDGVTLGLEQHIFSVANGALYYGVIDPNGILEDKYNVVDAKGLLNNITAISVADSEAKIWASVVDDGKVKIGAYLKATQSWDSCGFIDMALRSTDTSEYQNAKIISIEDHVYLAAQSSNELFVQKYNSNMELESGDGYLISMEDILQYDFAYYKNILWVVNHTINGISVVKYDLRSNTMSKVITETDFFLHSNATQRQMISSIGCTILGNMLHVIYKTDDDILHRIYNIEYDYETNTYEAKYESEIALDELRNKGVSAFSVQNNDQIIYMVLSTAKEIE